MRRIDMQCEKCNGHDVHKELLFPRDNSHDLQLECLECGHEFTHVEKD